MDFFSRGYSVLVGESNQPRSASDTVRQLADRVAHSTLIEDRRAAILSLKGLSREYKYDVGREALEPLLAVLQQDREDTSIVKPVLETLNNLCARDARDNPPTLGQDLAARILHDTQHVELLLDIIEEPDFYVRFNAVQLLSTLLASHPTPLQDAILVLPLGVGRLMDLLDDHRDIVRNEALLLLVALTEDSAEIQKIVAFQGGFDRLLDIITHESGIRGGIIVQDCLQLLHNLLRYNVSNQNFFRETSCISRLPVLLSTQPDGGDTGRSYDAEEAFEWNEQSSANAIHLLDTIRLLVVPGNLNTRANQDSIYHCDLFSPLVQLALAPGTPAAVRAQALYCLGDIVRGNARNQDIFSRITVTVVPESAFGDDPKLIPEPVILSVLATAVSGQSETTYAARSAATYLVLSYTYDNPDTPLTLVSTLIPPPEDNPHSDLVGSARSAGSIILKALLPATAESSDPFQVWYAATILGHLLYEHPLCKQLALKVRSGDTEHGEDPVSLMQQVTEALMANVEAKRDCRTAIGYLTLLCQWVCDSSDSVTQFLEESTNLHFLIEQISLSSGAADPLVQGLMATLFTLIYQYNDNPDCPLSRKELEPIIQKRIGADIILSRLTRLRDAKAFQDATLFMKPDYVNQQTHLPELYFEQGFPEFLRSHYDGLKRALTSTASDLSHLRSPPTVPRVAEPDPAAEAETAQHLATIQVLETTVQEQNQKITDLEEQVRQLVARQAQAQSDSDARIADLTSELKAALLEPTPEEPVVEPSPTPAPPTAAVAELEAALRESEEKAATLEKEQEDLLVFLADQDTQSKAYRARLRELGDPIPPSDDEDEDGDEDLGSFEEGDDDVSGLGADDVDHIDLLGTATDTTRSPAIGKSVIGDELV
ncbi:Vesicle-mediated ER to Golgi transport protein [Dimargaris cristalligena]|nr:Vesicle-mediated ER to Golgi transport protein [Dimargaris cristalligena]